ncbi:MAG: bifunctional riboflavin kinase/FAD synthetase [Pseudomonadota bacterium]
MELIRGLHNLRSRHRGCAATIGNFDGVHRGHQAVLKSLHHEAQRLAVPTCVITFEPLPAEYFAPPEQAPVRLMRLRERYTLLASEGIDQLLILPFNRKLASTEAPVFVEQVLVQGLGIRYLLVGDDFKFGRHRTGDFALLQRMSETHGYSIERSPTHSDNHIRISSTRIRELLKEGDLQGAEVLLGRPYAIQGHVGYGAQRGRTIGFPTANIMLGNHRPPLNGVYAVTTDIDGITVAGIANLGIKPTVNGKRLSLEVHLLDYQVDLYGRLLRVEFVHKLRNEKRFESFDELKTAIATDEANARSWFADNPDVMKTQH